MIQPNYSYNLGFGDCAAPETTATFCDALLWRERLRNSDR
jgi:hypothetical protein